MLSSDVALVRQASREMVRELGLLNTKLDRFGITNSQCHILIELEHHGVLTAAELAERLNLDRSTMSRTLAQMTESGLIAAAKHDGDKRKKPLCLASKGKKKLSRIHHLADQQVSEALSLMSSQERQQVTLGLATYAKALRRRRRQAEHTLRPIQPSDDPQVARLIRTVMPEFGADGPGFAIHDPEVGAMSASYSAKKSAYFVVCAGPGTVVGGAGFGPLVGGDKDVCELKKMYFLPQARGLGLGRRLLDHILEQAQQVGYRRCYLETLEGMAKARKLYLAAGFEPIDAPMGKTGHFACDSWMLKKLR